MFDSLQLRYELTVALIVYIFVIQHFFSATF